MAIVQTINHFYMSRLLYIILFSWYALSAFSQPNMPKAATKISSQNYILILSSYQYDNPYSTAIAKKIQHQLEQKNPELIFRTVYASLDIQQTMLASRLNMQKAFSQARLTSSVLIPRILILIGDESWMLYRIMNLRGKWEKVPIILCGVNDKILKDYADFFPDRSITEQRLIPLSESTGTLNVTGVLHNDVSSSRSRFIRELCPSLKEIVYISNGSYNDEYAWWQEQRIIKSVFPQVKQSYFNSQQSSPDSIRHYISELSPDSSILLFNSHPAFLSSPKLISLSLRDEGLVNNDITGGYYTLTDQFAQQTATLVKRIFDGTPIHDLPFQYVQNHHIYLNAQAPYMPDIRKGTNASSEFILYNTPPPLLIRYLRPIIGVLLAIIVIVIGILIHTRTQKYQRHIQALLEKYKILHQKFQIIYDNMPIALLIYDEQGHLQLQNPTAVELENTWYPDRKNAQPLLQELLSNIHLSRRISKRENINQVLPILDGHYQPRPTGIYQEACDFFRLVVRYIPDEHFNSENILVMLIDTTDIYREKIAHKRVRSVFNFAMNKASIGVAEYNLCTATGIATDSWRRHLCIKTKQALPSVSISPSIVEEDQKAILKFLQLAREGKAQRFDREIRVVHPDGSIHHLREQFQVMEYQPQDQQIWIAELNQNIDKEKQLAAELQTAIQKAQEAERLKNTFIANMSHEIRSPLNAIVGFSNLMIGTKDAEIRRQMIRHIEESNEILLRLVNDIIDLSKIETGSMTFIPSETAVNALFEDLITIYQLKAQQKNLTLTCTLPPTELYVLTDKIRIKQVISNFITNAIKFTSQGSISLGYQLKDKQLYVYVEDTGIGIAKNQISKVFNRFYHINKNYAGYGLGLSISQAIIEGMHGEIGVESEEGKGSKFWFYLPVEPILHENQPAPRPIISESVPSDRQPHILVVEDDESNFLLLQFMLKNYYCISHAWNGEEAIERYKAERQDLILMDLKMPRKNGYQATAEIRSISPAVPIIATTAYAFSKDEVLALNSGFNAFLTKPLEKKLLLSTINHWLHEAK